MISVVVQPDTIQLPQGSVVKVPATWQDYQDLLVQLGDRTSPRLKYHNGQLLLMVPLPEHGKQMDIIIDVVKVLLRHQGLRFDSYPEPIMDLPQCSGIIPDHSFTLANCPWSVNNVSIGVMTHRPI